MGKHKLRQFAEFDSFPNTFTHLHGGVNTPLFSERGKWSKAIFNNSNPITLELGCGKGEYTLALANRFLMGNFIGVDIKGNRLWRGAKTALENNLQNVKFLRTRIEILSNCFAPNEIDSLWITFPDPQPGDKREKKRLTNPKQLDEYRKILVNGGEVHLKTDSKMLFDYSLNIAQQWGKVLFYTEDLYADSHNLPEAQQELLTQTQTYYEKKFLAQGFPICYLKFQLS